MALPPPPTEDPSFRALVELAERLPRVLAHAGDFRFVQAEAALSAKSDVARSAQFRRVAAPLESFLACEAAFYSHSFLQSRPPDGGDMETLCSRYTSACVGVGELRKAGEQLGEPQKAAFGRVKALMEARISMVHLWRAVSQLTRASELDTEREHARELSRMYAPKVRGDEAMHDNLVSELALLGRLLEAHAAVSEYRPMEAILAIHCARGDLERWRGRCRDRTRTAAEPRPHVREPTQVTATYTLSPAAGPTSAPGPQGLPPQLALEPAQAARRPSKRDAEEWARHEPSVMLWARRFVDALHVKASLYFFPVVAAAAEELDEDAVEMSARVRHNLLQDIKDLTEKVDGAAGVALVYDCGGLDRAIDSSAWYRAPAGGGSGGGEQQPPPMGMRSYPLFFRWPLSWDERPHWPNVVSLLMSRDREMLAGAAKPFHFADPKARASYAILQVDPRVCLVVVFEGGAAEGADSRFSVNRFLDGMLVKLRLLDVFEALHHGPGGK